MPRHVSAALAGVVLVTLGVLAAPQQARPPTAAQRQPVFRAGTHFVRVDAYPSRDGKIIEGLTPDDFEILEDGKPQKVESFDFIKYDTFTPEAERRDPSSQREGFDMAADPRYRVFVLFLFLRTDDDSVHAIRQPLINFLDRVLGPNDLFGLLTSRNSAKDLVLGQKTGVATAMIDNLWRSVIMDPDHNDDGEFLRGCGPGDAAAKSRYSLDATFTALESLVTQLGSLRQERKNIIYVGDDLPHPGPVVTGATHSGIPNVGITNGRVGIGDHANAQTNDVVCQSEIQRLAGLDFDRRYRELLQDARKQNVTFYAITPSGLQAPYSVRGMDALRAANDNVTSLAHETDGIAIVNSNDLQAGMRRIADDLSAYYLLGYYPTNTTPDGGIRTITVRLKPSGAAVRARRQYRAPTRDEMSALAGDASRAASPASPASGPSPRDAALAALDRPNRPFAAYAGVAGMDLTVVAELSADSIQAARWKDGADVSAEADAADGTPLGAVRGKIVAGSYAVALHIPVDGSGSPARVTVRVSGGGEPPADDSVKLSPGAGTLVGDVVAFRLAPRMVTRPVAVFEFTRNERVRLEWPVLAALDRREVKLLDRMGHPLPVDLPLAEDAANARLVLELPLSGLSHGDYLVELTAGAGQATERRLVAIRVK